jgi:NAD-dependent deacetylase sirtuin 5
MGVGLCQRAGFPEDRIVHVQGTMFEMKCEKNVLERNDRCNYSSPVTYPVNAGFTIPDGSDISDARVPLPPVTHDQLPHCPICVSHMRPAISFRGENGYKEQRQRAHSFLSAERTDLMLVVGTTGKMIASAHYITRARARGAKIVYVNLPGYKGPNELCKVQDSDWVLEGDAAKTLPEWFKSVSQTT